MGLFKKSPEKWCEKGIKAINSDSLEEGVEYLKKAIEEDYGPAWYYLALCYDKGWGVEEDPAKARECYYDALNRGVNEAWLPLGLLYRHRSGATVKKDSYYAIYCYEHAAAWGEVEAMLELGDMHSRGIGILKDPEEAMKWYMKAAEMGSPSAMASIGTMYVEANGVEKDEEEIRKWYTMATEHAKDMEPYDRKTEVEEAFHWLRLRDAPELIDKSDWNEVVNDAFIQGDYKLCCDFCEQIVKKDKSVDLSTYLSSLDMLSYTNGDKVLKTADQYYEAGQELRDGGYYEGANKYFRKSAELGNARSLNSLGFSYIDGTGVPKDEAKGIELIQKAAEKECAAALANLGIFYKYGRYGLDKDLELAVKYLKKGAEQEHKLALRLLGDMYQQGEGVEKDIESAIQYYERALEAGDARSAYNLAWVYRTGEGKYKDLEKEIYYYEKAASMDYPYACVELGQLLMYDRESKKDFAEAEKYLKQAAHLGNKSCFESLGDLYALEKYGRIHGPKAMFWYKKSAKAGSARSQYIIGDYYYSRGSHVDMKEYGRQWIEKSAEQGCEEAIQWLASAVNK